MPRTNVITDRKRAEVYEDFINKSPTYGDVGENDKVLVEKKKANDFFMAAQCASADPHVFSTGTHDDSQPQFSRHQQPQVVHIHNSGIPWWAFFLFNRNSSTNNYYYGSGSNRDKRSEENNNSNFASWAGVLIIAGVVTAPAIGGAIYLASEVWNNLERIYYNEGYLQAGLGLANIVLSLSVAAILTNSVLSTTITALAVSAGFANPVAWAFFIMGATTLFAAACIHWAVQEGIYIATAHYNKDALHPEEPGRFTVTDDQVADIKRNDKKGMKGLDGDKMQNVITAIHHDMTEDPSWMTRTFRYSPLFRSKEVSEKLNAIRTLRMTGKVNYTTEVETDKDESKTLHFTDCRS